MPTQPDRRANSEKVRLWWGKMLTQDAWRQWRRIRMRERIPPALKSRRERSRNVDADASPVSPFLAQLKNTRKNKGVGGPAKLDKVSERLRPCHQCPHLSLHPELAPELELKRA